MKGIMILVWAAQLANSTGPECLSAHANPSAVNPKRELPVFIEQMTRAQAVVLKATVACRRAVSSGYKCPSLPPLFPLPLPSLLWES